MTRDEAIGTLQAHVVFACEKAMLSSTAIRMIEDALDMAIEALQTDGDCISRQAALDMLGADDAVSASDIDKLSDVGVAILTAQLAMIKAVLALPSVQPEPKWIPCSERLPEYNEAVLTWDGGAFCIEKRIPYIRDDDGEPIESDWWVGDEYDEYESNYYPNLRDGAAIAWMPLPEPWKEGE